MTAEEGFVPTPSPVADLLGMKALSVGLESGDRLLYPGAGRGSLLAATRRFCSVRDKPHPDVVAVERNDNRCEALQDRFSSARQPTVPAIDDETKTHLAPDYPPSARAHEQPVQHELTVQNADFLRDRPTGSFNFIIANPPYLRYRDIPEEDRKYYSGRYATAEGQYDLFMPFIEQMLNLLAPSGYLVFIHPLSLLFSAKASPLRSLLRNETLHGSFCLPTPAFPNHTVSTAITVVEADPSFGKDGSWTLLPIHDIEFRRLLQKLGFSGSEIVEQADIYRNRLEEDKTRLRALRRREKKDGGFNPGVDPYCEEEQQSLASFA